VAERPVALLPEKGAPQKDHPVVSECAALTAACARKSRELDNSHVRWESDNIELFSASREAIARSRQLMSDINERNGK